MVAFTEVSDVTRLLALSFVVVAIGCASLVGIGDLTVQDAAVDDAAPEGGGCGWPGPDGGLVAYYAFEEQSGESTVDCSGNGHTAVVIKNDAGWWDAGFRGGAMRASNDGNDFGCMQLQVLDAFAIARAPPFSISAFVLPQPMPPNQQRWVLGRSKSGSAGPGWGVTMNQDASTLSLKLFEAALDGGDYDLSVSGSWLDGLWHHIIIRVPDDAGATVAIDDASTTDPIAPPAIQIQNVGVTFGCRSDGFYPLYGAIDEVRIYDHVLTAQEIAALK